MVLDLLHDYPDIIEKSTELRTAIFSCCPRGATDMIYAPKFAQVKAVLNTADEYAVYGSLQAMTIKMGEASE